MKLVKNLSLAETELKKFFSKLTIVEGKKDKDVLSKLGFSNIITINGQPIFAVVEKAKSQNPESVSILTDFDKEGERQASELARIFQKNQSAINQSIRFKIKHMLNVKKIEEIRYFTKLLYYAEVANLSHDKALNRKLFIQKVARNKKINQKT